MAKGYTSRQSPSRDGRDALRTGKKRLKTLDKYVIFSIAVLLTYTVVEFFYATKTGISHDTLTGCVYAAFGGEILSCCLIKIFKLRQEDDQWRG